MGLYHADAVRPCVSLDMASDRAMSWRYRKLSSTSHNGHAVKLWLQIGAFGRLAAMEVALANMAGVLRSRWPQKSQGQQGHWLRNAVFFDVF